MISMDEKDELLKKREIEWKKAMIEILDSVGNKISYSSYRETYDALLQAHKRIYEEDHDAYWLSGMTRGQLDTYLLIRIFSMLKKNIEMKNIENLWLTKK